MKKIINIILLIAFSLVFCATAFAQNSSTTPYSYAEYLPTSCIEYVQLSGARVRENYNYREFRFANGYRLLGESITQLPNDNPEVFARINKIIFNYDFY
ncbi:MAG: hypothetical protein RRY99_17650 [Flavobacterium sp.]